MDDHTTDEEETAGHRNVVFRRIPWTEREFNEEVLNRMVTKNLRGIKLQPI